VKPDNPSIRRYHPELKFMILLVKRGFTTVLAAPLHIIRVYVGTPEIRLIDPLLGGITKDSFSMGA
jgi:hypothetical protein